MKLEALAAQAAIAALNVGLAALVLGARPRSHLMLAVGVLFAGNAVRPLAAVANLLGIDVVGAPLYRVAPILDDALTVGALLAIPLLWKTRDARRLPAKPWLALGAATLLAYGAALAWDPRLASSPFAQVAYNAVLNVALVLGGLVFLDATLDTKSRLQQSQAGFFLAAYLLAASINVRFEMAPLPAFGALAPLVSTFLFAAPWVAVIAPGVGLVVAVVRRRLRPAPDEEAPPLRRLVVLAAVPLGFGMVGLGVGDLSYMLVRPLLFAHGIFRHRLLGDEPRERTVVGAVFASALLALFVQTALLLNRFEQPMVVLVTLPISLVLVVGIVLGAPLLRGLLARDEQAEAERNRDIYVAALEESLASGAQTSTTQDRVLARLRSRLRISDREHAILEIEARRAFGRLDAAGLVLNRYRIVRQLGEGGFGRTFLAHDEQVRRDVVLKIAKGADADGAAEQLLREARLMGRLDHPGIVRVHDVERVGDEIVLVLEYVAGGSLAERIAQSPLPAADARRLALDVLGALEAVHERGIVHRDVKPSNILVPARGPAKLADFGVARRDARTGTASGFSLAGDNAGSVRYMSPEQVRGLPLDGRSDLYSLAATLVEAMTGEPYLDFTGRTEFDARLAILEDTPTVPAEAGATFGRVLAAALSKDPAARPASAAEMRALLESEPLARIVPVQEGPAPRKDPRTR